MNEKCAEISADIPSKKNSMSTPKSIQGNQNKGKLARRARSFKDDFLDILAQMRSPGNNSSLRSQSPNSSPARNNSNCGNGGGDTTQEDNNPFTELDNNVKQVQIALKHFRDVVSKNKLEMLPGNGTIVLDTVTNIVLLLKGCLIDEQSSSILSATSQLHQNVARLIRLCDNVMLYGSPALGQENVASLVQAVQEAVQNLVSLSREKLSQRQSEKAQVSSPSQQMREAGSCPSLPDIPLTPRERQILQQTATSPLSLSSESILQKFELLPSPPPKPPLPIRISSEGSHIDALDLSAVQSNFSSAPPLPPKTRHRTTTAPQCHLTSTSTMLAQSSDTISISPAHSTGCNLEEFSSSLLSISNTSSMDSILNSSSHHEEYSLDSLRHEEFESEDFSFCSFNSSSSSTHFSLTHTQSSDMSPPALPQKMRCREVRLPSHSDYSDVGSVRRCHNIVSDKIPPPLPLKKRHIMAYMEMFGNCSTSSSKVWTESLLVRHSVHTYSAMQAEWARSQADVTMSTAHSCLFTNNNGAELLNQWPLLERFGPHPSLNDVTPTESPPALPPKLGRMDSNAPPTPPPRSSVPLPPDNTPSSFLVEQTAYSSPHAPTIEQPIYDFGRPDPPVEPKRVPPPVQQQPVVEELTPVIEARDCEDLTDSILYEIEVTKYLVFKITEDDGPDIRGGHPDALLVQATMANKNDFLYQEAFLTTYRTFLSPLELLRKLERRYGKFAHPVTEHLRQRAARNAFSLLVRVVSDLTISDLGDELLQLLMELIFHLLCCGELNLARALRVKVLEKCESRRFHASNYNALLTSLSIHTRPCSLLDFKSEQLAEQMTLLDAELFLKIEIPEVLVWAKEQNEERSPNLTRFTEHFNKMSFWARSRILEQKDARDRERYVVKFIKVMRYLRRVNNFNSYLALLSALDSAPIRRLEWHRQITEGLKEYCALIDSSSSFRAYRLALAETQPPCIPYIGLVLQDLTFVHIGNSDLLLDGNINFSKRWQQFNIVENMKRFKKCQYSFKKQERILALFNNFDDCLSEESMWQISETIKPRGANKK